MQRECEANNQTGTPNAKQVAKLASRNKRTIAEKLFYRLSQQGGLFTQTLCTIEMYRQCERRIAGDFPRPTHDEFFRPGMPDPFLEMERDPFD